VLVADDHRLVREGLVRLIDEQHDLMVVGEASNGSEALALARSAAPDVVLVDVSMSGGGVQLTEALAANGGPLKIIALTRHTDSAIVRKMFAAGASGYVLKQSVSDELIRGIRTVGAGKRFVDPALAGDVDGAEVPPEARYDAAAAAELSPLEELVLQLVAAACSNKEIAERLSTRAGDVVSLKTSAMRKTGLTDRVQVMAYARSRGWI
jgi:DNA-binding NarL/FixJ family response regulator